MFLSPSCVVPRLLALWFGVCLTGTGMAQISAKFESGHPLPVVLAGEEAKARFVVENAGQAEVKVRFAVRWEDFEANTGTWQGPEVSIPAQGRSEVSLAGLFERFGWFRLTPEWTGADGKATSGPNVMVARIAPVGMRSQEAMTGDFLFSTGGSLHNDETMWAAMQVGVDWSRDGYGWNHLEPEQGKFNWTEADAQADRARKSGIIFQYLAAYSAEWAIQDGYPKNDRPRWTSPPKPEHWRNYIRAVATRYKDVISHYEIWNEPDLAGFFQGTTEDYLEMLKIAHEEIKQINPNKKVMTGGFAHLGNHGGHSLNPDFIRRVTVEGRPYYDIWTGHEHGDFMIFQRILNGPMTDVLNLASPRPPVWFNETSEPQQNDAGMRRQAAQLVKKISYSKIWGAEAYSWFLMYGRNNHLNEYSMFEMNTWQPRMIYPAFNNLVRLLRDKPDFERADVTSDDWVLVFSDNRAESVIIAWSESQTPATDPVLITPPSGAEVVLIDLMGNEGGEVPTADGMLAVQLTSQPQILRLRGSADGPKVLGRLVGVVSTPFVRPGSESSLSLALRNPSPEAQEFKLNWRVPGTALQSRQVQLPAGAALEVELPISIPEGARGRSPSVSIDYELVGTEWKGRFAMNLETAELIPAGPIEQREPDFVLDQEGQVVNFFQFDPSSEHKTWQGPADLSAKVWIAREGAELIVRIDVLDEKHHQPHSGAGIWDADSIQMGLIGIQQTGTFWEFGFARSNQGEDMIHLFSRPSDTQDISDQIRLDTEPINGGLRYTVKLPMEGLGLADSDLREGLRFSLIVNDDDGEGRQGYIQISEGIGRTKDASLFPVLSFE
jgi:hypothetical protein